MLVERRRSSDRFHLAGRKRFPPAGLRNAAAARAIAAGTWLITGLLVVATRQFPGRRSSAGPAAMDLRLGRVVDGPERNIAATAAKYEIELVDAQHEDLPPVLPRSLLRR